MPDTQLVSDEAVITAMMAYNGWSGEGLRVSCRLNVRHGESHAVGMRAALEAVAQSRKPLTDEDIAREYDAASEESGFGKTLRIRPWRDCQHHAQRAALAFARRIAARAVGL